MRRYFLFILLSLPIYISNAKEKDIELVLGTYWNSYSNKSLQVSAVMDDDNELTLFLEIPVYHRGVQEMKLEIKEKNIPKLREELLNIKRLRNMYIETIKDYGIDQMNEKLDTKLPPMRLWWKVGDYWKFSEWERCRPRFLAEKGICYVYVEEQTMRGTTMKEELIKGGIIMLGSIIFGEDAATAASVSEAPEFITFKWGFSTQKDIMTVVNLLDVDSLKKKYKTKKK